MRLSVLATAFIASVASALPTSNTTLSTSLEPNGGASTAAECHSSTLEWAIDRPIDPQQPDGKVRVSNMFDLVVSPSAGAVSWVEYTTPEYGRDYYRCGFQKILCVEFDGWKEDKPKVSFKFNGRWYRHKVENKRIPAFSKLNVRQTFEYWDCVIKD